VPANPEKQKQAAIQQVIFSFQFMHMTFA